MSVGERKNSGVPKEIELLADSIGFGPGYTRTYRTFAVYVVEADGRVGISRSRTDRYFKTRRFAQKEADNLNRHYGYRWNYETNQPERLESPHAHAFVKEIEVTERIVHQPPPD